MRGLLFAVCAFLALPAGAQELSFHAGITREREDQQITYAWTVAYGQAISEHAYFSLGWVNEGHLDNHHRDGPVAQIGGRLRLMDRRLALSFAVGPYAYFDTTLAAQGASYANDHGYGIIYSTALSWYSESPWFFQLGLNRIETDSDIDTNRFLLGVGYQLAAREVGSTPLAPARRTTGSEIAVFAGQTILNSFHSQKSVATAIEYRRGIARHADWTLGWLHEGGNRIIRRDGLTTQLWAVRAFPGDRLTLGAGAGAYIVVNKEGLVDVAGEGEESVSGIVTLTTSYRFSADWLTRLSWHRIVTGYSRDTDVILLGIGRRF